MQISTEPPWDDIVSCPSDEQMKGTGEGGKRGGKDLLTQKHFPLLLECDRHSSAIMTGQAWNQRTQFKCKYLKEVKFKV